MNIVIDIGQIKDKALLLIPRCYEDRFKSDFDTDICYDLIENIEDYIAEGVASYYLNDK